MRQILKAFCLAGFALAAQTSGVRACDSLEGAQSGPDDPCHRHPPGAPRFIWPANGRIMLGCRSPRDGVTLALPLGTAVRAADAGVVAYAGNELKAYGALILIRHPNGFVSAYADNSALDVKRGDRVARGQIIARSGESGAAITPQLHFELRDKKGIAVDPRKYLACR